ncbi:MAG: HlyD family secretion protein [Syntrophobacterales bacterium]|jgi:membrane fusion protein (multidrug efflux system)
MFRKPLVRLGLILLLLVFIGAGLGYWYYLTIFVSTDDAYVDGHIGIISPQVSGRVSQVLVDNNDFVRKGQILVTLEPQDYQVAVAHAEANLNRLRQDLASQYVKVSKARAEVSEAEATLNQAITDRYRYRNLFERRTVPKQTLDRVNTQYKVAKATVEQAQQNEREALAAIGGSTKIPLEEQPAIKEAEARLQQARLNLGYTKVMAHFSGYVTRRQVKVGNWVQPGQALMALVPLEIKELWISANYKETQLTNVCIGQPAEVTVDAYPKVKFKGKVDSIMAGTGSAFSLLPPENATGNWVKVVQRVPVKIVLLPPFPENRPLRLGMSTIVTIDTRERTGPKLLRQTRTGFYRTGIQPGQTSIPSPTPATP